MCASKRRKNVGVSIWVVVNKTSVGKILSFAPAFVIILRIKGPNVKSLTKPSLSLESSEEN